MEVLEPPAQLGGSPQLEAWRRAQFEAQFRAPVAPVQKVDSSLQDDVAEPSLTESSLASLASACAARRLERAHKRLERTINYADLVAQIAISNAALRDAAASLHIRCRCESLQAPLPPALTELDVRGSGNLKSLPQKLFAGCKVLQKINMAGCTSLVALPALSPLIVLATLNLRGCTSLTEIPDDIGELTSLRRLELARTESLGVLPDLDGCLALSTLDLSGSGVCMLPRLSRESLRVLDVSSCDHLGALPDEVEYPALRVLNVWAVHTLQALPPLSGLAALEVLNLCDCDGLLELPPSIDALTVLQELDLGRCSKLRELPPLGALSALTSLNLVDCEQLRVLPVTLGTLGSLELLDLSGCRSLELLPALTGLGSLRTFHLRGCSALRALPEDIYALESLRSLDLRSCQSLEALPDGLGALRKLRGINMRGCGALATLPDLSKVSIKELVLDQCYGLKTKQESSSGHLFYTLQPKWKPKLPETLRWDFTE